MKTLPGADRCMIFFFNLLLICSTLLIVFGGIILEDEGSGVERFTFISVGGFAIAVGLINFLFAFFGCCVVARIQDKPCGLVYYATLLLILCIVQCVLGALALISIQSDDRELTKEVRDSVAELFGRYLKSRKDRRIIDDFQQDFECCGIDNAEEWLTNGVGHVPQSCCEDKILTCNELYAYEDSCTEAFKDTMTSNITIAAGIAIGFAALELFGGIIACVIRFKTKKEGNSPENSTEIS